MVTLTITHPKKKNGNLNHLLGHFFAYGVDYLPSASLIFPLGISHISKAVWKPNADMFAFHKSPSSQNQGCCLKGEGLDYRVHYGIF